MALTVTTSAASTLLSSIARMKTELGISGSAQDATLTAKLQAASDTIVNTCSVGAFARQVYLETLGGPGGELFGQGSDLLMLSRTPIASIASVLLDGDPILDFTVEDAKAGFLYREIGWDSTKLLGWALTGYVRPGMAAPRYSVAYSAGYLLPSSDYTAITISAVASDNSLNDTASGFPLLVAGDVVTTSGFVNAANNGRATVVSRTASKVVLSGLTLTNETAGASVTIACRNLPYDLEEAALETAKIWYREQNRDPFVTAKSVGPLSIAYSRSLNQGLPPRALEILERGRYIRIA